MASTRASSPAGDVSTPTSPQLTPRSKLKALLAAVDNESSDDESTGPVDAKSLFAAIDKNKKKQQELNLERAPEDDSTAEDDVESDDAEAIKPRGRIAARMHANFTKAQQPSRSPSSTSEHARQDSSPPPTSTQDMVTQDSLPTEDGDDEDDIIAQPRRRLARPNRAATPETTVQVGQKSPTSLFVSPSPHKSTAAGHDSAASDSDEDDLPVDLSKNARFKALVEKKRKERQEREAEEERKRAERAQLAREQIPAESGTDEDDVSDISDDDGGRKLTQDVSRPSRKASRKALEEMNRETQRLSRSLQLAHEAKTRKKINKSTLFQRFNFRAEGSTTEIEDKQLSSSRPTTPGSARHQTDADPEDDGTPPSSPPTEPKPILDLSVTAVPVSGDGLPPLESEQEKHAPSESAPSLARGHDLLKGKAVDVAAPIPENKQLTRKPTRQVRVKLPPAQVRTVLIDSDDELEITNPTKKDKLAALFSRAPENKPQESTGMKVLRNLAHLSSPPREPARGQSTKQSMTLGELQMSLQQRAKAQAKLERERRLEFLRSKGIVVQSAEEREREREQVEDIVARARQEVEEIMLREREEAKKTRKEKRKNGEADPLAWDDSDDDSFHDSEEEKTAEVELSGSEDDEPETDHDADDTAAGSENEEVGDEDEASNHPMFADEAEEAHSEDEAPGPASDFSDDDIEAMKRPTALRSRRSKKHVQIISDDEDDHGVEATPKPKRTFPKSPSMAGSGSPKPPTSVLRSATKTFIPGLPIALAAPAGLGLTQMFAGTMDNSQVGPFSGSPQDLMPSIDQFPDSQFSATAGQSQGNNMIFNSQPSQRAGSPGRESQTQMQLHYSQSQAHGFDSLVPPDATQMSDFLEPTQDEGFQDYTPLKQRFIDPPPSTDGTMMLQDEAAIPESPLVRKRGKLLRRVDLAASDSTLPFTGNPSSPTTSIAAPKPDGSSEAAAVSPNVFRLMEKAAKRERRLKKKYDKKKSKAMEMVEEQAEESEDEYAGLGGVDGEDSSDEDEELAKEMIDDSKDNEGDDANLAGLFADRERAADAAQVDKLFRDITTGMLRKRRRGGDGNDFDLSDSDDGGEARRRMKRRQFAKMQKALFADERISKIAENPRNAAFLKSIEDMKDDDEWDFGENFAENTSTSGDDSQSQNASQADKAIPDSQPPTTGRKRSRTDDHAPRPGPSERRVRDTARPSTLAEVRRSLSTLLDEPNASTGSVIPATDFGSDSEEERERPSTSRSNKENRRLGGRANVAVVDRITLKRNSSSLLSTSGTGTGAGASAKLAFTAPSAAGSGGFRVPALLRRATTNSSKLVSNSNPTASTTSTTTTTTTSSSGSLNKAASFGDDGKLKKNAGKRSGINYFAHENERRAKVAEAEKRREARKWKGAEGRGKIVGGLFGSGAFE
ncbi:hypothetical protein F5Y14DRAFT_416355 [Nemania sp. NC0429]|nr:hypothetical protein F5Y14DRAFT_416355 [Nemania sp. NC0429]